jgi:hypothetical protein
MAHFSPGPLTFQTPGFISSNLRQALQGRKATRTRNYSLTSLQYRGYECVEMYLHFSTLLQNLITGTKLHHPLHYSCENGKTTEYTRFM